MIETEAVLEPVPPQSGAEEAAFAVPAGSRVHTVWVWQETRDCLWRLARRYYGDPWLWKKIFLANRNAILDPNLIFPKQRLVIPALARKSQ